MKISKCCGAELHDIETPICKCCNEHTDVISQDKPSIKVLELEDVQLDENIKNLRLAISYLNNYHKSDKN